MLAVSDHVHINATVSQQWVSPADTLFRAIQTNLQTGVPKFFRWISERYVIIVYSLLFHTADAKF